MSSKEIASGKVTTIKPPSVLYEQYKQEQGLGAEHERNNHTMLVTADNAEPLGVPAYAIPCVAYPYHNPDGTPSDKVRCRLLNPLPSQKYWQPTDSGDFGPYFPQGKWDWQSVLADPSIPMLIPEGEVKAIIAQDYLDGIAVLAIGGVSMWRELLSRVDVIWKGRKVIVAFDHDDGQEPGQYKPEVVIELGKFCQELAAKGASVQCTQLGILARDQGLTGKIGLDDYFRKGGDGVALMTQLVEPPEGCELLAEMFSRYVVVTLPKPVIWDKATGRSYQFKPFQDINLNKFRMERLENKLPKKVMVAHEFIGRHDRPEAGDFDMDPSKPYGYLPDDKVINTWKPFRVCNPELVRDEYKLAFGRLVEVLAGEFPAQVSQWLAHYVRKPWERTSQAVLVSTPFMGIGKSLLGEIIGALVGDDHWAEVSIEALKATFNDNLEGRTWLLWNEMDGRFGVGEAWLRNLFSQKHVRIEVKGGAAYEVKNLRRYMMNSNNAVAMRIAQGNRRVWICRPTINDTNAAEWKEWLWREVVAPWSSDSEAFLSSVRAWLDEVDLEDYNPMAEVINGTAAAELMEASMTQTQSAVHHLIELWESSGDDLLVVDATLKKQFKEVFTELASVATAKGWEYGRKQVSFSNSDKPRLWIVSRLAVPGQFGKDSAENKTYVGAVTSEALKTMRERQKSWIVEACNHLNQVPRY